MARLQAARTANTAEYQALKNWCDARLGQNLNEGYQWLDWYNYLDNYALLYRITGDPVYGNKGVVYLKAILRDRYPHGDGLGGPNAILVDRGYVSRSMGVGAAVGRDWLFDAPDMTPALVDECTARMNDWYTILHQPGNSNIYAINEPWVNYWAGHFAMTYTAYTFPSKATRATIPCGKPRPSRCGPTLCPSSTARKTAATTPRAGTTGPAPCATC